MHVGRFLSVAAAVLLLAVGLASAQNDLFLTSVGFAQQSNNMLDSSCFSCAQAPAGDTFAASSCESAEDACRIARTLLDHRIQMGCTGFGCSASQLRQRQDQTVGGACRLSDALTQCRPRMLGPVSSDCCPGGSAFMCTMCCESGCRCGAQFNFTSAQADLQQLRLFELNHRALGSARLESLSASSSSSASTSSQEQAYRVVGFGSSEEDGVRIELPPNSRSFTMTMRAVQASGSDDQAAGRISFRPFGLFQDQTQQQQLWDLRANATSADSWGISLAAGSALSFNSMRIELRREGRVVLSQDLRLDQLSSSDQNLAVIPSGEWIVTPMMLANGQLWAVISLARAGMMQILERQFNGSCPAAVQEQNQSESVSFGELEIPSERCAAPNSVLADQLVMMVNDASPEVQSLSAMEVHAADIESISVFKEHVDGSLAASSQEGSTTTTSTPQSSKRRGFLARWF